MKKKMSEAQLANLKNGVKTQFNGETAVKANAASQEAKKLYRPYKEVARDRVSPEDFARLADVIKEGALTGDPKMIELFLNYLGEKPADKVEAAAAVTISFDASVDQSWLA